MSNTNQTVSLVAKVIDEENGIVTNNDVSAIRIQSKDYRVLILPDFAPLLGEVNGTITLLTPNGETVYKDIKGYYKLQKNEFTLIINKEYKGWYKTE